MVRKAYCAVTKEIAFLLPGSLLTVINPTEFYIYIKNNPDLNMKTTT